MKPKYVAQDDAFTDYCSMIASDNRLLIITQYADIILADATSDAWKPLSRWKLHADESGLFAHPAIVDDRLYVRLSDRVIAVSLR